MMRNNELRTKIKDGDKEALQEDFQALFAALDDRVGLDEFFRVGRFVRSLRDYVLEEAD